MIMSDSISGPKVLFKGGGFPALWYEIGMGKAMIKDIKPSLMAGYSAGAIAATISCFPEINIDQILEVGVSLIPKGRIGMFANSTTCMMDQLLPEDAHIRASGLLGIILCDPKNGNKSRIVTQWSSRDELIQCLVASSYIPCFSSCGRLSDPIYGCRDGFFSNDLQNIIKDFDLTISIPSNGDFTLVSFCKILTVPSAETARTYIDEGEVIWHTKLTECDPSWHIKPNPKTDEQLEADCYYII